ncbi:MAG TPA: tetratricopeptide repeat protein, partial [Myxococcaceae bacterium]|nr:tetratricopeptide repeat protein [Myxococcaceae bacterium]
MTAHEEDWSRNDVRDCAHPHGIFVALIWALLSCASRHGNVPHSEAGELSFDRLEAGQKVQGKLAANEVHAYRLALSAGQYARLLVNQPGVDVALELFAPDGRSLTRVDDPITSYEPEELGLVAEVSGAYRLEVKATRRRLSTGAYEMTIAELRPAAPQDTARVAAERVFAEATELLEGSNAESFRKAVEKFEQALPMWRAIGDKRGEGRTLALMGFACQRHSLRDREKTTGYLTQALSLHRDAGDRVAEAFTLNTLGRVYLDAGDAKKALAQFEQSLDLSRKLGDPMLQADALKNVATVYSQRGDHAKAIQYCEQVLALANAEGDYVQQMNALGTIGYIYSLTDDPPKDVSYSERALAIAREIGERGIEAALLNNIAGASIKLGDQ